MRAIWYVEGENVAFITFCFTQAGAERLVERLNRKVRNRYGGRGYYKIGKA